MRNDISIISDAINGVAESIMQENYLSKEDVVKKLETFITSALNTIFSTTTTALEIEAAELKGMLGEGKFDYDNKVKHNKMFQLGKISDEIKFQNRANHVLKNYSEYNALKEFIKSKDEKLYVEFCVLQPEVKVGLLKKNMKEMSKQLVSKKDRPDTIVYSTKKNS